MQHATRLDEIKRMLGEAAVGNRGVEMGIDRAVFGLRKPPEESLRTLLENPGFFVSPDQTTYFSIMQILEEVQIDKGKQFIDLGSGVGRVVISVAIKTGVKATGVEIVAERYRAACESANELGLTNVSFVNEDLLNLNNYDYDYIFMFNPIYKNQSSIIESKIRGAAMGKNILIIASDDVSDMININSYCRLRRRIRPTSHSNGIGFQIFESSVL